MSTLLHWAVFFSSLRSFCSYKDTFVKQLIGNISGSSDLYVLFTNDKPNYDLSKAWPSSLMTKPNQKWNGNACMSMPSCFFFCRVFRNVKFEHCSRHSLRFLLLAGIFVPPIRHHLDSIQDNYPRVLISPLTCLLSCTTPLCALFCGFLSLHSGLGMGQ